MFNRQKGIQANGQSQETRAQSQLTAAQNDYRDEYPIGLKEPVGEESLGTKLETTFYTVNRIESQIHNIRVMLFGDVCDTDGRCGGLDSVDDAVNSLKYKTADIEKTLEFIVYRLSGSN